MAITEAVFHFSLLMLLLPGETKDYTRFKNLRNWSCAIGYGVGSGSPLSPSFTFGLELAKSSQVCSTSKFLMYCIFVCFCFVKGNHM